MANEFYTLIVVPHAKAKFRKFQVSVRMTKWVLGSLVVLAVALVGIVAHYTWINVEVAELSRLRGENLALAAKARAYEENAGRLQTRVLTLQNMVTKLGLMAGVEERLPESGLGGVGGVSRLDATAPSLDIAASLQDMDQTISSLTRKSSRLQAIFEDQAVLLASTPSIWPVRGYFSDKFGNRTDPFTGMPDFHPGIDVSTPRGTKVLAPADGVVTYRGRRGAYGNTLVIDHGFGIVTRYAHLEGYEVRPGQRVQRGDVIGFVGSTGRSTAPHLHYEVWVDDQLQNPIKFILEEYRSLG